MRIVRELIVMALAMMPVMVFADAETPIEVEKKSLSVSVSTLNTSDSAIMATKPQDGERPVKPLNIHIGPSKLTLFGYAQTQFDMTKTGPETKNSFTMMRVILMANAELTRKLSFFLMIDAASTQASKHLHEYYAQYAFMPELKVRVGQFKTPYTL